MDWFIVENGEAAGPFKESEIRRWLDSGKLTPETHANHEGMDEWKPLSELPLWACKRTGFRQTLNSQPRLWLSFVCPPSQPFMT